MGVGCARAGVFLGGALLVLAGLALIALAGPGGALGGLICAASGGVLMVAVGVERLRYRSEQAEQLAIAPGPGGGEMLDAPLEGRFRRTDEVFEDPTSGRRMRVWLDPATGERRYRAEDGL